MIPSSVPRLVQAGLKIETFAGGVVVEHVAAGEVSFPSGKLSVFDPQFGPKDRPVQTPMPGGRVPVQLALVRYEDGDERVAGVWTRLSQAPVKRWATAKPSSLYVESGVVCLADASKVEVLASDQKKRAELEQRVEKAIDQNYKDTRSWGRLPLSAKPRGAPPADDPGLFFCSSGFGDGVYGHYLGYDAKGAVTHVLIDFGLLLTEAEIEAMQDEAM